MKLPMQPFAGRSSITSTSDPLDPRASLAEAAKGWHSIQLAVLGFMGFTGAARMGEQGAGPEWVGWLSMALMGGSLGLAILAIYLVGRVAYPFYGGDTMNEPLADKARGQLRTGIRTTYVAVIIVAIACLSAWWPSSSTSSVELSDANGAVVCGEVVAGAPQGKIWLKTSQGNLTIDMSAVASMRSVGSCN